MAVRGVLRAPEARRQGGSGWRRLLGLQRRLWECWLVTPGGDLVFLPMGVLAKPPVSPFARGLRRAGAPRGSLGPCHTDPSLSPCEPLGGPGTPGRGQGSPGT